jgi:hypothetical protein
MQETAADWVYNLRQKHNKNSSVKRTVSILNKYHLQIKFFLSIPPKMHTFIDRIFDMPLTLYITVDNHDGEICAVIKEPTSANIYEYCREYTNTLMDMDGYFPFMTHGVDEVNDRQYNIKITRDEWYAFSR